MPSAPSPLNHGSLRRRRAGRQPTAAPSAQQYTASGGSSGDNLSSWPPAPSDRPEQPAGRGRGVPDRAQRADRLGTTTWPRTPLNQAPTASFTETPNDLTVALNAAASPTMTAPSPATPGTSATADRHRGEHPAHLRGGRQLHGHAHRHRRRQRDGDHHPAVTVTAPPPVAVTVAADAFDRTVAAGLGTADTGGAWTVAGAGTTTRDRRGRGLGLPVAARDLRLNSVATRTRHDQHVCSETSAHRRWPVPLPVGAHRRRQRYLGRVRIMSSGSSRCRSTGSSAAPRRPSEPR